MTKLLCTVCHYIHIALNAIEAAVLCLSIVLCPVLFGLYLGVEILGLSYVECGLILGVIFIIFVISALILSGSDYYDKHYKKGEKE